jgi:U3 small nucleolar RNA-associated protein 12
MLGLSADAFVLRSLSTVRANDLEQALLLLPFGEALRLLQWVAAWLAQGSQVRGRVRSGLGWSMCFPADPALHVTHAAFDPLTPACGTPLRHTQVELSCRVATLLLRLHHSQLTATPSARQTLVQLHARMRSALQGLKDTLGHNIAALRFLQRSAKEAAGTDDGDAVAAARRLLVTQ